MEKVFKYLLSDVIGGCTGIHYGTKGEKVELIKTESQMCLVQGKTKFFTRPEELLDDHPDEAIEHIHVVAEITTPARQLKKSKIKKPEATANKLF